MKVVRCISDVIHFLSANWHYWSWL